MQYFLPTVCRWCFCWRPWGRPRTPVFSYLSQVKSVTDRSRNCEEKKEERKDQQAVNEHNATKLLKVRTKKKKKIVIFRLDWHIQSDIMTETGPLFSTSPTLLMILSYATLKIHILGQNFSLVNEGSLKSLLLQFRWSSVIVLHT